ncbi:MAG: homocysteine S-methyltransferase family protein [Clostridia bacterium]|nr:homocysteine S-methyltransferase family protein [Clostridia bacterium]
MGTVLQRMGVKPGENGELLSLTRPQWIEDIHRAYIRAGSRVIYTNTFGANRRKLRDSGYTVQEVIGRAVSIARGAAEGSGARVALDIGPIGALLAPLGTLAFEEACDIFAEIVEAGRDADLIVIETMTDLQEARAALLAAKEHSGLPVYVTMSFDSTGRTFTGCSLASMAHVLEGLGADAIGINCSVGPRDMLPMIVELKRHTRLPVIAKPNAGMPDPVDGHYDLDPAGFAAVMAEIIRAGADMVGGCCGTAPEYLETLNRLPASERTDSGYQAQSFVCTSTVPMPLNGVRVIGERINPTGKKRLQQALLEDDLDYVADLAIQQMDAGADILDVNVGCPGVDEVSLLPRAVKAIQAVADIHLQMDSANPDALEAALRVYCGKAIINSVSGKEESLRRILPMAKKYGAAVVGLALDENGLPDSAEKRYAIAEKILNRALALGIPREDVFIDCLALTVSAQQDQARETLEAISRVTRQLGLQTVLGVSNISFGLPERPVMTRTFLAAAMQSGLSLPILNPNQREMLDTVAAFRVLSGEDRESRAYVARFAGETPRTIQETVSLTLDEAIYRGLKGEAGKLARQALAHSGEMELVENRLIPALDRVGTDYEKGAVFLPQLLSAAQAAQAVFEQIRESLLSKGEARLSKGRIVMATVQGDIHDIGKNIVKTVLENYGYSVLDLGRDVPPEQVVQAVREERIGLVGLSALMTTTLPAMEETVRQLRALPDRPAVMVGGAVVTADYASRIGADYYARDARDSVNIARKVLG